MVNCPKCKSTNIKETFTLTGYPEDFICRDCKHIWNTTFDTKLGIHSDNFGKLLSEIESEIPEPYNQKVISILYKCSTHYL